LVESGPGQQGASLAGNLACLGSDHLVRDERGISVLSVRRQIGEFLSALPPALVRRRSGRAVSARNQETQQQGVVQSVRPSGGVEGDLARRSASESQIGEPFAEARPVSPLLEVRACQALQEEPLPVSQLAVQKHPQEPS